VTGSTWAGVVAVLLSSWYGTGASITLVVASAAGFTWMAALAIRVNADQREA
jgi:hypothetical protein